MYCLILGFSIDRAAHHIRVALFHLLLEEMNPDTNNSPAEPRCIIVLKNGKQLEVNLSATRIKHLRRNKMGIPMIGPDGQKAILKAQFISHILPQS